MWSWHRIKKELTLNKEGIIGGALVGLAAAFFAKAQGYDLSFTLQSQGVFDSLAKTWELAQGEVMFWKFAIALMFAGMLVGYVIDSSMPEQRWRKIKKKLIG